MNLKKTAIVLNGFIHDFAAGYWLAAVLAITMLHRIHTGNPPVAPILNPIERLFFWQSVVAMLFVFATGAGRTFTYVENWYGPDAERVRRRMLIVKHLFLIGVFALGYLVVCPMTFH